MVEEQNEDTRAVDLLKDDLTDVSPEEIRAAQAAVAAQLETAEDRWRRAAADYDNLRKRMAREIQTVREQERQHTAKAFLPVVDGLDRALSFGVDLDEGVLGGMQAIRAQATDALRALGYPEIVTDGAEFDPQLHEAVSVVEDASVPPRSILAVTRPGFGTSERMLRPAAVVVTRRPDEE